MFRPLCDIMTNPEEKLLRLNRQNGEITLRQPGRVPQPRALATVTMDQDFYRWR
jgi:hypothetical protein